MSFGLEIILVIRLIDLCLRSFESSYLFIVVVFIDLIVRVVVLVLCFFRFGIEDIHRVMLLILISSLIYSTTTLFLPLTLLFLISQLHFLFLLLIFHHFVIFFSRVIQ